MSFRLLLLADSWRLHGHNTDGAHRKGNTYSVLRVGPKCHYDLRKVALFCTDECSQNMTILFLYLLRCPALMVPCRSRERTVSDPNCSCIVVVRCFGNLPRLCHFHHFCFIAVHHSEVDYNCNSRAQWFGFKIDSFIQILIFLNLGS